MAALTNKPRRWNHALSIGFSVDMIVLRIIRSLNRECLLVGEPDTTDTSKFQQLESAEKVGDYTADVSLCSQRSAVVRQHACIGEVRGLS